MHVKEHVDMFLVLFGTVVRIVFRRRGVSSGASSCLTFCIIKGTQDPCDQA